MSRVPEPRPDSAERDAEPGMAGLADDLVELTTAKEHLSLLLDVSEALSGSLDHEMSLKELARLLVPRLADGCVVDVVDASPRGGPRGVPTIRRLVVTCADPGKAGHARQLMDLAPPSRATPNGILKILDAGRALLAEEVTEESLALGARDAAHMEIMRALCMRSALIVPLTARTRPIGVLWLYTAESGRRYGPRELALAQDLAGRAALALDNARLFHEACEAVRVRDEFLSVASHELKTPLTSLHLLAQQLLRAQQKPGGPPPELLGKKLGSIDAQCRRLARLVEQLLDVSRIADARLTIQRAQVDLGALVREGCAALEGLASGAGSPLQISTPASGPVGAWDARRLESVVENLVANAIKFGRGKPIDVAVVARDDCAVLSVRDRGIGIGIEDQTRIFDRFERAVSARHYGGLGLGLWISQQAVRAMGGSIRVQSEPANGSEFVVTLPLGPTP